MSVWKEGGQQEEVLLWPRRAFAQDPSPPVDRLYLVARQQFSLVGEGDRVVTRTTNQSLGPDLCCSCPPGFLPIRA
jgi:hypothetical protein